ncbi:class I lanthipeptide [Kordia sp.]|uniref:class I lanthipeptide n=1 Tax=Kordia sp. TaxID=1965332 RepID=UPI003B5A93BE
MKKQKLSKGLSLKKTAISDLNNMYGGATDTGGGGNPIEIKTLPIWACKIQKPSRAAQNTCQFSCAHNNQPSCNWSDCC